MTSRFEELHPKPIEIKCLPDELNKKCNEFNLLKWNLIREGWLEALKWAISKKEPITEVRFECEPPIDMIMADDIEAEIEAIEKEV